MSLPELDHDIEGEPSGSPLTAVPVPRLTAHLRRWVGEWPPAGDGVQLVESARLGRPGWDGQPRHAVGVVDETGAGVFGVSTALAQRLEAGGLPVGVTLEAEELRRRVPEALGEGFVFAGVFRWSDDPASAEQLPDVGRWLPAHDDRVPEWLKPFGGDVLVVMDDDAYVAGVGIKRHDEFGHELSVGTEEAARGRGLARRLVAQAARALVARGFVVTYLHAADNTASARVAEAAGFPDCGWQVLGLATR
ncbi:MAG: GNAT family N-acetyltransferase [Actinomycetales bacterium]